MRAGSLARRVAGTRPGRAIASFLREKGTPPSAVAGEAPLDGWLQNLFGERLDVIEAACADAGPEAFANFRDLDDDLWAMLLTRSYEGYPNIRSLLPGVPEDRLQASWNGACGLALMTQSKAFYKHVKGVYAEHGPGPLEAATVLDFGCGWGRLTRFFARDVSPGNLLGCDPVDEILEVCRRDRVPAELRQSEFVPERVPFEQKVDLVFSFSVFTHISEAAHHSCLKAIHGALNPGGILVVTVRPPEYLRLDPKMHGALADLGGDPVAAMEMPRYVFVPHDADPEHPQYEGGEMTYGETVVSLAYVRERWEPLFDLVDVHAGVEDPYQVAVTLRRRD